MSELTTRHFETGSTLFETTQLLDTVFYITQGEVALTLTLAEKTVCLTLGENQFIGDDGVVASLKGGAQPAHYCASAVALSPVTVVALSVEEMTAELNECSPIIKAWLMSFTQRILAVIEQLAHKD